MAALLALAATLQQRGQFVLARKGKAIQGVAGLLGLVLVRASPSPRDQACA